MKNKIRIRSDRSRGWFWVDNEIIDYHQHLTAGAKLVYMAMCRHCDENHRCYPSIRGMAKRVGLGQNTVERAITQLEKAELIHADKRPGKSTIYTLLSVTKKGVPKYDGVSPSEVRTVPIQGIEEDSLKKTKEEERESAIEEVKPETIDSVRKTLEGKGVLRRKGKSL